MKSATTHAMHANVIETTPERESLTRLSHDQAIYSCFAGYDGGANPSSAPAHLHIKTSKIIFKPGMIVKHCWIQLYQAITPGTFGECFSEITRLYARPDDSNEGIVVELENKHSMTAHFQVFALVGAEIS